MTPYHLWLTPIGDPYDRLASLIKTLSDQHGGPSFAPHITLLGEIGQEKSLLSEQVQLLATKLPPLAIELLPPAFEDEYFRCVYLTVKQTPELLDAYEQAQSILNANPSSSFHPHVSLLYGRFPERIKRAIIASLPVDLPKTFSVNLQLIRAESLHPRDWHPVVTIPFQGKTG